MASLNVLIVDDNKDITDMLAKYLKMAGHKCSVANDGRNGLSIILNQKFDAVLLDLAIPEFSGKDIIESLEKKDKLNDQKIILFTASSIDDDELENLTQKGVYSCLKKPIDPDELISYLTNLNHNGR